MKHLAYWTASMVLGFALAAAVPALAQEHAETPAEHHSFHNWKHWSQVFESPERDEWQKPDQVMSALNLHPGDAVADIGAGSGYFARRFAKKVAPNGKVLALDVEPEMVSHLNAEAKEQKLSNLVAKQVRPDDAGLAPGSTDLIFLCDVYHHIEHRADYDRKLLPALRPDGHVVLIDFKKDYAVEGGPPYEMRVARGEAIDQFKQAGFKLEREYHFLPRQYFLVFTPAK
jgi:cyclopropane fatty-acyl-phospholipid synthase-like methyltransferase